MAFSAYSTNPASNTTIAGQSIAENTTNPGTLNLAIRQLMADGKALANSVGTVDISGKANLNAPAFTGQPTYSGRGAFLYHNSNALSSGRIYMQASGGSAPAGMIAGDFLLEY